MQEIAAWKVGGDGMVEWADGNTVQGYYTVERVQHVLDLLAEDKLVREVQPPPVMVADDEWEQA